jgi:predicted amidohydrolase YtcJ
MHRSPNLIRCSEFRQRLPAKTASLSSRRFVRTTVGSAFAEFQEKVKGTIEVGKLADLVILSDDIFSIDRSKISGVRVVTTIMNGSVSIHG